ncbi:MAG: histidine kinase [Betaproteobacteria bacterium]|nr:histidine kinase [Betaproteobacteria bacterium]
MLTATPPMPLDVKEAKQTGRFTDWLRTHRGAIGMAGLLAFAGPVAFFTGTLSVMRTPALIDLVRLGLWWILYGVSLWALMLLAGYGCERLAGHARRAVRGVIWVLAASLAAAVAGILTAGRTTILIEQGVVHSSGTAHLYAFIFTLIIVLLYFAHLRRSREHEQAAARLAAAQMAQRDARRRIVQARLQEVQARIDPQLLFEMLDTMRRLYERDAAQGERFLDELIAFLRAALPRLRIVSSSLLREVELARAYVRLIALAGASDLAMTTDVASDVMHARFPPGVLLPLLNNAVGSDARPVKLMATREGENCSLVLTMGAAPSEGAVARVQSLLTELYGTSGILQIHRMGGAINVILKVPYEYT